MLFDVSMPCRDIGYFDRSFFGIDVSNPYGMRAYGLDASLE